MTLSILDAHKILEHFLVLATTDITQPVANRRPRPSYSHERHQAITPSVPALERVLNTTLPRWRETTLASPHDPWHQHRLATRTALLTLRATTNK